MAGTCFGNGVVPAGGADSVSSIYPVIGAIRTYLSRHVHVQDIQPGVMSNSVGVMRESEADKQSSSKSTTMTLWQRASLNQLLLLELSAQLYQSPATKPGLD